MINRPKKKEGDFIKNRSDAIFAHGYNASCDDHDKFLPDRDEIKRIVRKFIPQCYQHRNDEYISELTEAIAKILEGKK